MNRLLLVCAAMWVGCGAPSGVDGGTGGTGGGGGTGGAGGGGSSGGGAGGGGGSTFLTDGGSIATLAGSTAFMPVGSTANLYRVLPDGGADRSSVSLTIHDSASLGSSCSGMNTNTGRTNLVMMQFTNPDGGALTVGTYAIAEAALPPPGPGATLGRDYVSPTEGLVELGVGVSGSATITQLTSTRMSGSFQSNVRLFADGGIEPLSGTFDTVLCPL